MLIDFLPTRIFIRPGYTDMRKASNGLSMLVQDEMTLDPFSGFLFLFCNKQRKLLKGLWWDQNGFWLCQKKLEKDKFPWPETENEVQELSSDELRLLLRGIDFWKAHKPIFYSKIS
jgi:transposase